MDALSMGKAGAALNKIKELDQTIVAPLAESRFPTVDARLDWLEAQATKAKATSSKQLDLSQGTFTNTEFVNGKLKLKLVGVNLYTSSGTWESPIIDLGDGRIKTQVIDVIKNIVASGVTLTLSISSSIDGITFADYSGLDPANPPNARYIKIKAILTSTPIVPAPISLDFNQSNEQNTFALGLYAEAEGILKPKTNYSSVMVNEGAVGSGILFSATLDKAAFKSIEKVTVN